MQDAELVPIMLQKAHQHRPLFPYLDNGIYEKMDQFVPKQTSSNGMMISPLLRETLVQKTC